MKKVTLNNLSTLVEGVNLIGDIVSSTLGPKGNNVIIQDSFGRPHVTKDGVTVASHTDDSDPVKSLAINVVKQAASATAKKAGDGTTTATLLTQALVNEGYKRIQNGTSPIEIKRDIERQLEDTLFSLNEMSIPVTPKDIESIATISANNDNVIGKLVAEGFNHVGKDGVITIEDSSTSTTQVDSVDGMKFSRGYLSPYFINNTTKSNVVLEDPFILVTDKKIRAPNEIVPILEQIARTGKPLLIIADNVDGQALSVLIINKMRLNLPICAIQAPAYGDRRNEVLKDIAVATGAELISDMKSQSLEHVKLAQLGSATKVIVDVDSTIIIGGKANEELLQERLELIKGELTNAESDYLREKLSERYATLLNKVAVIRVGAPTETERKEKKDRIDDALRATYSAVHSGYVPGGGLTLFHLANSFNPADIFYSILKKPFNKILTNASLVPEVISSALDYEKPSYGFNTLTGTYEDLIKTGVIDPTLVLSEALTNAVSAASMILLSSGTITDDQASKNIQYDIES